MVRAEVARLLPVSPVKQKTSGSCPQSPCGKSDSRADRKPFFYAASQQNQATSMSYRPRTPNHLRPLGAPHSQTPVSGGRSKERRHSKGACKAPPTGDVNELLTHIRKRMLERFRCIHDAFMQFDGDVSPDQPHPRDRSLTADEFASALGRLGFPAMESGMLVAAMDIDPSRGISLTEFLESLVNVSPEALLWELRCRLDSEGVRPSNLQKAFELLDVPWPARSGCGGSPGARGKPHLGRSSWLEFCAKLGLTAKDGEQLFALIDKDSDGFLDLREMFKALRVVAPETSFEHFVSKIFTEYGSLREAFSAHAKDSYMGYDEFLELASTLDVNDDNAAKLWQSRLVGNGLLDELGEDARLTEETFVHLMMMWAPDSSVQGLQKDLRNNAFCGVATSGRSGVAVGHGSSTRKGRSNRSGKGRKQRHLVLSSPFL